MQGPRSSVAIVALLVPMLAAAMAGHTAAAPARPAPAPAPEADGVPERWVVGMETIDGRDLDVGERIRVLPGARLDVRASTLRFAAHGSGPTGLVVEPGGEVRIAGSQLLAAPGAAGGFVVHVEGHARVEDSAIRGAGAVVLQPRPASDHVDTLLAARLEGDVPGWRLARIVTNASILVARSVVEQGTGAGVVASAPLQFDTFALRPEPAVRLVDTAVSAAAGPALLCQGSRTRPDLDRGLAIPLFADATLTQVELRGTTLDGGAQPALHCPAVPQAWPMPSRNVPLLPAVAAHPASQLLPPPPQAEPIPGPTHLVMAGGELRGSGVGALLEAPTALDSTATRFEGLQPAVRLASAGGSIMLADATSDALRGGVEVLGGAATLAGGTLQGVGLGIGALVTGGSATLAGTTVRGFATGVAARSALTLHGATVDGGAVCAHVLEVGAQLLESAFRACTVGVVLDAATGARLEGTTFTGVPDPLRVRSPDDAAHPEHFDHTVFANWVGDKPLLYVFQQQGLDFTDPVGHAVVAHSADIRVAKLDPRLGRWHAHASTGVVIGALTDQQGLLAALTGAALGNAFEAAWRGVSYEVYPGALKGPLGAEQQGWANEVDKAWMLVDKAQAQGRAARFVKGTLAVSRPAFLTWTGFTDEGAALSQYGLGGALSPTTFFKNHWWAEVEAQPGVWLELDPAYAQYDWRPPATVPREADADAIAHDFVGEMTFQGPDKVAAFDLDGVFAQFDAIKADTDPWNDQQVEQGASWRDIFGGPARRPVAEGEEVTRTAQTRLASVPSSEQWSFVLRTAQVQHAASTPALYGKRVTLSSEPATPQDAQKVEAAGGLFNVSRFQVRYVTKVYVDGAAVGTDARQLHPGDTLDVFVDFREPSGRTVVTHDSPIHVGGSYAVALDIGRTPPNLMHGLLAEYKATLEAMNATAQAGGDPFADHNIDQRYGRMMQMQGWYYFTRVHFATADEAAKMGIRTQPLLGAAVTGQAVVPISSGGTQKVKQMPPHIDVQALGNSYPRDGNGTRQIEFSMAAGALSSVMEGHIFEELYGTRGLSTVHILQEAAKKGQPIYHITPANLEGMLAQTALPLQVKNFVRQAVARGMEVYIHHQQLSIENWTGFGWAEVDPRTGATGWLIFGGVNPLGSGSGALEGGTLEGGALEGGALDIQFAAFHGGSGVTWDGFLGWLKSGLLLLLKAIGSAFSSILSLISRAVDLVTSFFEFNSKWEECQSARNDLDPAVRAKCAIATAMAALTMMLTLVMFSVGLACFIFGGAAPLCWFFLGVSIALFLIKTLNLIDAMLS